MPRPIVITQSPSEEPLDESFLRTATLDAWQAAGAKPSGIVRAEEPGGQRLAIKVGRGSTARRCVDALVRRPTRSARAFAVALRLSRSGVPTPAPLALLEQRVGLGVAARDALVCSLVDAPTLEAVLARDPSSSHDWIERAAHAVLRMHTAAVVHRDLKASNLLARGEGAQREVLVTDLDGASLVRLARPTHARRARDLGRLYVSLRVLGLDADELLAHYAKLAAWGPSELERLRLRAERYWNRKKRSSAKSGRELR